jgi:spoIIIJ-associated protein
MGGGGEASERLLLYKQTVENLLEKLEIQASVEIRDTPDLVACRVNPAEGHGVIFEGPEGRQAALALEYLANRIVSRGREDRKRLVIAVGEEVEEGDRALATMAVRLGASARRMNRPITVVGMDARHRRIVHLSLSEEEGIRAKSVGDGSLRRIVIEQTRSEE